MAVSGIAREYRLINEEATLQMRSDRMKFRPYGLAGGDAALPTRNVLMRHGEVAREMPVKFSITLKRGDAVRHEQPGGGRHGDPAQRAPALIDADARNEKVTPRYARGVSINRFSSAARMPAIGGAVLGHAWVHRHMGRLVLYHHDPMRTDTEVEWVAERARTVMRKPIPVTAAREGATLTV